MDRLLNVMTGIGCALIALVLISVRRSHIRAEYSVSWLTAAVALLALSRSRAVLAWISSAMGIEDPPVALIIVVFCIFLPVFFRVSTIISDLKDANIAMAQRVAILEFQLQSSHESRQTGQGS